VTLAHVTEWRFDDEHLLPDAWQILDALSPEADTLRRDRALAAIAKVQHGAIAARQLAALGFSGDQITLRVRQGRLHRFVRGVYAVGHAQLSQAGRRMAFVLAAGPGAMLSHRAAAGALVLRSHSRSRIDVVVYGAGGRPKHDDLDVHRSSTLTEADVTWVDGVPCTSVARTLCDLGQLVPGHHVRSAFGAAERNRRLDSRDLDDVLSRGGKHKGVGLLREVRRAYDPRWAKARSELELLMLDVVDRQRLGEPEINEWLLGRYIVDFLWRDAKLIVEVDGAWTHGTAGARRADALRDKRLLRAGYRVLRFSWEDVTTRPSWVAAQIRAVLAPRSLIAA
jgi:very-short-patch-repair endonuclease